jgi:hypothetical protein
VDKVGQRRILIYLLVSSKRFPVMQTVLSSPSRGSLPGKLVADGSRKDLRGESMRSSGLCMERRDMIYSTRGRLDWKLVCLQLGRRPYLTPCVRADAYDTANFGHVCGGGRDRLIEASRQAYRWEASTPFSLSNQSESGKFINVSDATCQCGECLSVTVE